MVKFKGGAAISRASDKAYAEIRAMVLSGELQAGTQIREEAMAERCGVSRTPVREALRRLEAELLVTRTETNRSFVADWSLGDVADAFQLRAMLEGHAARLAAERIKVSLIDDMREVNARLGESVHSSYPDVDVFLETNRKFHAMILDAAGSRRLAALLGTLVEQPVVWRTAHQYRFEDLRRSHSEHEELLASFERGDGSWAEAVMVGHVRRAYHAYADAHRGLPEGRMREVVAK